MKGLLLTHFFVEEKDASTKYDWVEKAILKILYSAFWTRVCAS